MIICITEMLFCSAIFFVMNESDGPFLLKYSWLRKENDTYYCTLCVSAKKLNSFTQVHWHECDVLFIFTGMNVIIFFLKTTHGSSVATFLGIEFKLFIGTVILLNYSVSIQRCKKSIYDATKTVLIIARHSRRRLIQM